MVFIFNFFFALLRSLVFNFVPKRVLAWHLVCSLMSKGEVPGL